VSEFVICNCGGMGPAVRLVGQAHKKAAKDLAASGLLVPALFHFIVGVRVKPNGLNDLPKRPIEATQFRIRSLDRLRAEIITLFVEIRLCFGSEPA
jgi:hypothetical protein